MHKALGMVAFAAALAVSTAPTAQADSDTVYFSHGRFQCSIDAGGAVGCDLTDPVGPLLTSVSFGGVAVPMPFPVREMVIDATALPARPGFDAGTPNTLPGGNPDIGTGTVDHAGATCGVGFHGSFYCSSKGHQFSYYESIVAS
ncbi:hypothetical protein AB0L57_20045 [Nocardia sp. NPDC052254]|uniref:hypothetical protein n=1 Tax=Nocardia sp. NPDC052254 TaxID=3155681 RepID=UPI00341EB907